MTRIAAMYRTRHTAGSGRVVMLGEQQRESVPNWRGATDRMVSSSPSAASRSRAAF